MVDSVVFIGAIIAGITQFIKIITPSEVDSKFTIPIAVLVGIVIALIDTNIGLGDITVALGVMTALGTAGVIGTAEKIG